MKSTLIILVMLAAILPWNAQADEADADLLVKDFLGFCVQNMADAAKVESSARLFKWKKADEGAQMLPSPGEHPRDNKLWTTKFNGHPAFSIATNEARFNGTSVAVCSMANPDIAREKVAGLLKNTLQLDKPLEGIETTDESMQVWSAKINGTESFIAVTDATSDLSGVAMTLLVPPATQH